MKRQYMKPTVLVVKLQQRHHMLAGSPDYVQDVDNPDEDIKWVKKGFGDDDLDM